MDNSGYDMNKSGFEGNNFNASGIDNDSDNRSGFDQDMNPSNLVKEQEKEQR